MPTTDRVASREIEALQAISSPPRPGPGLRELRSLTRRSVVAYELHPAGTFSISLATAAPLDGVQLARIGREVGVALDELWARRIVQRDVKPANIVRAVEGTSCSSTSASPAISIGPRSRAPAAHRNIRLQSPEQAQGRRNLTIHADAFSLGVTLIYPRRRRTRLVDSRQTSSPGSCRRSCTPSGPMSTKLVVGPSTA